MIYSKKSGIVEGLEGFLILYSLLWERKLEIMSVMLSHNSVVAETMDEQFKKAILHS